MTGEKESMCGANLSSLAAENEGVEGTGTDAVAAATVFESRPKSSAFPGW